MEWRVRGWLGLGRRALKGAARRGHERLHERVLRRTVGRDGIVALANGTNGGGNGTNSSLGGSDGATSRSKLVEEARRAVASSNAQVAVSAR